MMKDERFSIRGRLRSFYYAAIGIKQFFRQEHNARIHLAAAIVAGLLAWRLKVSRGEAIALVIVIGLVWVTEMLNTCIEKAMDMITREHHPQVKIIKDLAAGAVLIAAITAVIVGSFIFIPKFL
ncbi:MAG: diacylglycerol kinase family protein [Chitinophagaceae bacterium]|nr:diacylglycerol kinase family protein [Chitinophagaceae bacterium]